MIVTITDFPVLRLVTFTFVPNRSERCAAVKALSLNLIPLAVLVPSRVEYTEAMPLCGALYAVDAVAGETSAPMAATSKMWSLSFKAFSRG